MASNVSDQPDFGWTIAITNSMRGYACPLLEEYPYRWIAQAVRLFGIQSGKGDCVEGDGTRLSAIAKAHEIYQNATPARLCLHAALMARDSTAATVARALNLDALAVEAYDAVFFNVLDRKESEAYLRQAAKFGVTRERGMKPPNNRAEVSQLMIGVYGTLDDVRRLSGAEEGTWAA